MGGTPWEVPQTYEKWSPHNHIRNWKVCDRPSECQSSSDIDLIILQTPELVIHGGLDYRLRRFLLHIACEGRDRANELH